MNMRYVKFVFASMLVSITLSVQAEDFANDPLKLVWISLDALNTDNLKPYLDLIKNPHPRGLKWLIEKSHGRPDLQVSYPSITAPSHISTITCAGPGSHGVFLNSGNWDGTKDQNGFAMPFDTETWVQALRQSGVKVGIASYPSVDGTSEKRSGDFGIAYDSPTGKVQYIKLSKASPRASVELTSHQVKGLTYRETFSLTSNGEILAAGEIGSSKSLVVGKPHDLFFVDGAGSTNARKAGVTFMNLGPSLAGLDASEVVVAVSPVSVMPVTNAKLRSILDQKNIVWSNLRDYGMAKYGDGVSFTLTAVRHRRNAEMAAIHEMMKLKQLEAMFIYFEDIDVVLHAWSGVDRLRGQLASFLAQFDQDLGRFIDSLPKDANLVVMGDHGMTAVQYELNIRKLLPAGAAKEFQIRTSGGAMMLYPVRSLEAPERLNLNEVAETLRKFTVEFDHNRPVFRKVVINGTTEAKELGLSGPNSPSIMAFADEGMSLTDRMDDRLLVSRRDTFVIPEGMRSKYPDPLNNGVLVQPSPLGAHGHDSMLPSMRTHLTLSGPVLSKIDVAKVQKSIQVVPEVANALGWKKPSACH